jgi:hypothetical protein
VISVRADVLVAHQPAYLPWPGYFSRLLDVGQLVLLDHVQYSAGGWQNRNYVRGRCGERLRLTVPVSARGRPPISLIQIADQGFGARHWRTLRENYASAPYWPQWEPALRAVYTRPWTRLAELNEELIRVLLAGFGLPVTVLRSSSVRPGGAKTAMLANLACRTGATVLRTGEGAARYLDAGLLAGRGIRIEVAGYRYPDRSAAPGGPVAALDLLLRHGPNARQMLADGAVTRTWEQPADPAPGALKPGQRP